MTATATTTAPLHEPRRFRALFRRWPTALGAAATGASLAVVAPLPDQVQTWLTAWWILLAAAIYLTWGTARGDLTSWPWLAAQATAVLGFGAVAIAGVAADADASRWILAAGWLAHALWDVAHHRAGRVVPRWYAETCLVIDLLLATVLMTVGQL